MVFCAVASAIRCLIWRLLRHKCSLDALTKHSAKKFVEDWCDCNRSVVGRKLGITFLEYDCEACLLPPAWDPLASHHNVVEQIQDSVKKCAISLL